MTRSIHILPPDLANQIAAGEVVERPASVVKELVENALDAGARRVDVRIESGGLALVAVKDDGHGMAPEDARLALERHATSKLRRFSDLDELISYGFRGEALPSIASVSRFTLRTRAERQDEGLELELHGGSVAGARPRGMPVGTELEVRDLFFNVPARRKFLRSTGTESGHVTDVLENAALARPDVSYSLERDGRVVRQWTRASSRSERVLQLSPGERFFEVEGERGPLRVEAYLTAPERARKGTSSLALFLNGRPIKDRALAATLSLAFGDALDRGTYPRGVVYLELPPRLVDVNVHPQKTEVRFADPRAVADALHALVRQAWERSGGRTSLGRTNKKPAKGARSATAPPITLSSATLPSSENADGAATREGENANGAAPRRDAATQGATTREHAHARTLRSSAGLPPRLTTRENSTLPWLSPRAPGEGPTFPPLRLLQQTQNKFLICEGADGVYVLDQHALGERVIFEKLRRAREDSQLKSQPLLFPLPLEVPRAELALLEEHLDFIQGLGVDLRLRSETTLALHGVPELLRRLEPERLLRELVSTLSDRRVSDDERALRLFRRLARSAAPDGQQPIPPEEASSWLGWLAGASRGLETRKVVLEFSSYAELERKRERP